MTTIQISGKLQQKLNKMKVYSQETYEEVIWNLLEDTMELSIEVKQEIEASRAEVARGSFVSLTDLKKKYTIR